MPAGAALALSRAQYTSYTCSGSWVERSREGDWGRFLFQAWGGDLRHQASTWDCIGEGQDGKHLRLSQARRCFVPITEFQGDRRPPSACLWLFSPSPPCPALPTSPSPATHPQWRPLLSLSPGRHYGLLFGAVQPPGPWGRAADAGGRAPAAGGHEEVDGPAGQERQGICRAASPHVAAG